MREAASLEQPVAADWPPLLGRPLLPLATSGAGNPGGCLETGPTVPRLLPRNLLAFCNIHLYSHEL